MACVKSNARAGKSHDLAASRAVNVVASPNLVASGLGVSHTDAPRQGIDMEHHAQHGEHTTAFPVSGRRRKASQRARRVTTRARIVRNPFRVEIQVIKARESKLAKGTRELLAIARLSKIGRETISTRIDAKAKPGSIPVSRARVPSASRATD